MGRGDARQTGLPSWLLLSLFPLSRVPLYTWSKAERHEANAFRECFSAWVTPGVTPALPALPSSLLPVPLREEAGASSERSAERDMLVVIGTLEGEGKSG